MGQMKVWLVGASTFSLITDRRISIAQQIELPQGFIKYSYSKNALQLEDIPAAIVTNIINSEILILHVGIMDHLPRLKIRAYPCLKVQRENGFLYDIAIPNHQTMANLINLYNRFCYMTQWHLKLFYSSNSSFNFSKHLEETFLSTESKIIKIIILTPPPVVHPGINQSRDKTIEKIYSLSKKYRNIAVLDYNIISQDLIHDKSGHLVSSCRTIFTTRLSESIKEVLNGHPQNF